MHLITKADKTIHTAAEVGGKARSLQWLNNLGFRVPPAIVFDVSHCVKYWTLYASSTETARLYCVDLAEQAVVHIPSILDPLPSHPVLFSVRSGAPVSMPGMMDTILNVGIPEGDKVRRDAYIKFYGKDFYYDCRRRYLECVAHTIHGIKLPKLAKANDKAGDKIVDVLKKKGIDVTASLVDQFAGAIQAVFQSWNSERAIKYRELNKIEAAGTAVIIQLMVFGNLNDKSCTGVVFSRDTMTGEHVITGDYLVGAQGEDVVSGVRTPSRISDMKNWNPQVYDDLITAVKRIEKAAGGIAQDIEFTVQDGVLYMLQARAAKMTAEAELSCVRAALKAGTPFDQATQRLKLNHYVALTRGSVKAAGIEPLFSGIPASNGVVKGVACCDPKKAVEHTGQFILVVDETKPEYFPAMAKSVGIVTRVGGMTCHAAVVARAMNKPCIVGADNEGYASISDGDVIVMDGNTGNVWVNADNVVVSPACSAVGDDLVVGYRTGENRLAYIAVTSTTIASIPKTGHAVLDISALSTAEFKPFIEAVTARPDLKGIIRVSNRFGNCNGPEDRLFMSIFSHTESSAALRSTAFLSGLVGVAVIEVVMKSWILDLGIRTDIEPDGLPCTYYIEKFSDFINIPTGVPISISPRLVDLLKDEGSHGFLSFMFDRIEKELGPIYRPSEVDLSELLFEVFKP